MSAQHFQRSVYPLIGIMLIVGIWQAYTSLSGISPLVLPSPLDIARFRSRVMTCCCTRPGRRSSRRFWDSVSRLPSAFRSPSASPIRVILNLILYPILVATQSIPKVAIAPIILVWFGLGMSSKLALAFLVAFFPVVVDTATGLQATPPGLLELARALRASPRQVFLKVQMPAALPFIFAGAKVAITLAVIGAVIGEFVGSVTGLGNLVLTANSQLDGPLAWAALIWLSGLGIVLFSVVALAERLMMPWEGAGQH